MFGNGRENKNAIAALEARIVTLSKIVTDNYHDTGELKALVQALQTANEELVARVAELESRQNTIRDGLRAAVVKPTPLLDTYTIGVGTISGLPLDLPMVDHIHVNCDLVGCHPNNCIYCHPELNPHNKND